MRHQGRITEWRDPQGFGFITPNAGGRNVFVHINAFAGRGRRPVGNELVTYELVNDSKGRPNAVRVAFVGDRTAAPRSSPGRVFTLVLAAPFLLFVFGAATASPSPVGVLGVYALASVIAFLAYALDKSAAINRRWRTPESTLHLLALVGGWPGAALAQRVLRHKSSKPAFRTVFWLTVLVNCAALAWIVWSDGTAGLRFWLRSVLQA